MPDAGAEYAPGTLVALASVFRASGVGCAGGKYAPRCTGSASVAAEASYFSLEYRLMAAENRLGILANASGTALAFRRSLWQPIRATSAAGRFGVAASSRVAHRAGRAAGATSSYTCAIPAIVWKSGPPWTGPLGRPSRAGEPARTDNYPAGQPTRF